MKKNSQILAKEKGNANNYRTMLFAFLFAKCKNTKRDVVYSYKCNNRLPTHHTPTIDTGWIPNLYFMNSFFWEIFIFNSWFLCIFLPKLERGGVFFSYTHIVKKTCEFELANTNQYVKTLFPLNQTTFGHFCGLRFNEKNRWIWDQRFYQIKSRGRYLFGEGRYWVGFETISEGFL